MILQGPIVEILSRREAKQTLIKAKIMYQEYIWTITAMDVAILDAIISAKLGDAASASGAGALAIGSSTFCTDVRRVGLLCRRATRRSLVVLDEFGDGTRSGDGLGLLSALLHHLATRSTGAPFAMVQTHFSELFDPVVLPKHANIQLCTMAVEELEEEDGGCKDI